MRKSIFQSHLVLTAMKENNWIHERVDHERENCRASSPSNSEKRYASRRHSGCGGREASAPPCLSYRRYSSSSSTVDRHLKELIIGVSFPLSPHMCDNFLAIRVNCETEKGNFLQTTSCTCRWILTRWFVPYDSSYVYDKESLFIIGTWPGRNVWVIMHSYLKRAVLF